MSAETNTTPHRGPLIVVVMFLFAAVVTAGLWSYWNLHTLPFRELTEALGTTFPDSSPRVEGGRHKMHKGTPNILRIVMRVSYNPREEADQFEQQISEVLELAAQHTDLTAFDECQIHLFQQLPQQEAILRTATISADQFPTGNQTTIISPGNNSSAANYANSHSKTARAICMRFSA